jgi:hypothetical protein
VIWKHSLLAQIWDAEAHRRVDPELPRTEVIVTVTEE